MFQNHMPFKKNSLFSIFSKSVFHLDVLVNVSKEYLKFWMWQRKNIKILIQMYLWQIEIGSTTDKMVYSWDLFLYLCW